MEIKKLQAEVEGLIGDYRQGVEEGRLEDIELKSDFTYVVLVRPNKREGGRGIGDIRTVE